VELYVESHCVRSVPYDDTCCPHFQQLPRVAGAGGPGDGQRHSGGVADDTLQGGKLQQHRAGNVELQPQRVSRQRKCHS